MPISNILVWCPCVMPFNFRNILRLPLSDVFHMGGRVCDVRVDLGLSWSSCLGLLTSILDFHWFVASCRSQPCRFNNTKTLPTPSSPWFYPHGQLTQTCPALAKKTATILELVWRKWVKEKTFNIFLRRRLELWHPDIMYRWVKCIHPADRF